MNSDGHSVNIFFLRITGVNRSDDPIENVDGFLRSNITNEQLPIFFDEEGQYLRTIQTRGIPPHRNFVIIVPFTPIQSQADFGNAITSEEFIKKYSDITINIKFDGRGSPYTRRYTQEEITAPIDQSYRDMRKPPPARIELKK
jgi:hypothetical protein